MNTHYIALTQQFENEYDFFVQKIDNQIEKVAEAVYHEVNQDIVNIDLEVPLYVGVYEELFRCYPTLERIKIVGTVVQLKLSVLESFEPFLEFDMLSIRDKMAILSFLENHLFELNEGKN